MFRPCISPATILIHNLFITFSIFPCSFRSVSSSTSSTNFQFFKALPCLTKLTLHFVTRFQTYQKISIELWRTLPSWFSSLNFFGKSKKSLIIPFKKHFLIFYCLLKFVILYYVIFSPSFEQTFSWSIILIKMPCLDLIKGTPSCIWRNITVWWPCKHWSPYSTYTTI